MAFYISPAAKDLAAKNFVSDTVLVRAHTGIPGTNGEDNTTPGGDTGIAYIAKEGWSPDPDISATVSNTEEVLVGKLSDTQDVVITHLSGSLIDGTFLTWVSLLQNIRIERTRSLRLPARVFRFQYV